MVWLLWNVTLDIVCWLFFFLLGVWAVDQGFIQWRDRGKNERSANRK